MKLVLFFEILNKEKDNAEVSKRDYLRGKEYKSDILESIFHVNGRVIKAGNNWEYEYHIKDHLGNVRVTFSDDNNDGYADRKSLNDYYTFGMEWNNKWELGDTLSPENKYRYNGKEYVEEMGWDNLMYGARYYNPTLGIFHGVDPLSFVYSSWSPYNYTLNNPIRFTDPTGMGVEGDFIIEKGKLIGNDGKNDGKLYVIKTTSTSNDFDSGVPSAGISGSVAKETEKFIKNNSGNAEAFQNISIAYDNSIEVISDQSLRQGMIDIVNNDNGRGGESDANNREYGGIIRDGKIIESTPGDIGNPKTDLNVSITHKGVRNGDITFHSHPSGQIIEGSQGTTIGGSTTTYQWGRAPSSFDIRSAKGNEYVFSRGDGTVYIYNSSGVIATIPQKRFVNPK